jgi:osmoprotectant transport system ATP-binding protein
MDQPRPEGRGLRPRSSVKRGDKIAVMRAGGSLAQFSTPAELLSSPQDTFVAGFVGRDRGYRALGFAASGTLPLARESIVRLGDRLSTAHDRQHAGWVLVLDDRDVPQGWLSTRALVDGPGSDTVALGLLNLGGTPAIEGGSLREALDAALSSPSGRGVVTHPDGRFAGTVTASQVLARIDERAAETHETVPHHTPAQRTGTAVPAAPAQRGLRP